MLTSPPADPKRTKRWALAAAGGLIELWAISCLVWPPGLDLARHVALFLAAWLCYLVAIRVVLTLPSSGVRRDLTLIFVVSLVVRGTLLFTPPTLSDDIFRAVWDARLVHAGINPYELAPGAAELATYRDTDIWPRVNAKEQRTPYPPLAELLGAAVYPLLPGRTLPFQALAAALDLVTSGLLALFLHRVGVDPRRALVVAWSPMGALQFAHSGHNDSAMTVAFVTAGLALTFRRHWMSVVWISAAGLIKVVPVLALPVYIRETGWRGLAIAALVLGFGTLPFVSVGPSALSGLLEEGREAQFNDSFHFAAQRLAGLALGDRGDVLATAAGLGLVLAAAGFASRAGTSPLSTLVAASRVLAAYVLVAAVVQPWYVAWLGPLMAVTLRAGKGWRPFAWTDGVGWLWFSGLSILTDLTYQPGGNELWPWVRTLEYGPLWLFLALAALSEMNRSQRNAKPLQIE